MVTIHVIGAGGTGSYFLKEFCRFAQGRNDISEVIIYDGDTVEEKNLSRQCFTVEDIGRNKALVMAEILNAAFDIPCRGVPEYLHSEKQIVDTHYTPVLIGCVDNHAARMVLEKYFKKQSDCILFDSANEYETGEVVFAYKKQKKEIGKPRSFYFPEVKKPSKSRSEMSCTELNSVAPQHIATNMLAANQLLCGICNYLEDVIHPGFTMFNSFHFSTSFIPYKEG